MKKISSMIRKNIFLLGLLAAILPGLISCSEKSLVKIDFQGSSAYPTIEIDNPNGSPVVFKSVSDSIGSIGFEMDGNTHWITGKPVKSDVSDSSSLFTWKLETGNKVLLDVKKKNGALDFSFQLISADTTIHATRWMINAAASDNEYFSGIFERVVDGHQTYSWKEGITTAVNLRNERVEMHLKPTVSAYAPFYISSNNYGMFVKGTWPGVYDFCKAYPNIVQVAFEGPDFQFRVYTEDTPMKIVQKHALETGPSFVPPEWALGPWRWRDNHYNKKEYFDGSAVHAPYNSDLVEDILMMKYYDIPCRAYWIDRPWGPGKRGFDDYKFEPNQFPDPESMIHWLNKNNVELMMWIAPFVMGDMADYAENHGYALKSRRLKNSRQVLMDFTNPEAVKWWGKNGPGKLARMGIKGFKLDRADGEKLLDSSHMYTYAGTSYRQNFNDYPRQYVKAAYEGVKPVLGNDFILFPRAMYTGSSRYGGMWAGDTGGQPEGLRSVIIGVQRCAVMGYPVWGSDVGGYSRIFTRETTMRWLGFGCFSPIMEVGPNRDRGFWNSVDEPNYDTALIATWRLYAKLRMQLVPYIKEQVKTASENGTPVVRPLFLEYPNQAEAWKDWQTYKFGPDILVSAVWKPDVKEHKLYLPSGETWIDAWTHKEYQGGKYITVDVPLYKTPFFIRKGADIQLPDLNKLYRESLDIAKVKPSMAELESKESWK